MHYMERDAMFTFRLPAELRARLQEAADADHRTLASLTILLLEEGLATRDAAPRPARPNRAQTAMPRLASPT